MNFSKEKLIALLPAQYRIRDADVRPPGTTGDGPLEALLGVVATQIGLVEEDIAQLYDNWFIETCDDKWVVPYIGALIGARILHPVSARTFSRRAWVANTLSFRRRKGTATMLEQLARDATGWPAHAVEFFERLAWSQNYNHVRLDAPATASLASANALELVNGPFDPFCHTVDVRSIDRRGGRYNIPNIGLFLWRLQSYPIGRSGAKPGALPIDYGSARAYKDGNDGRYTFSPLGMDGVLFNNPQTEDTITQLAGEANVPGTLRRRALHDELEALRQALVDGDPARPVYFNGERAVLRVIVRMGAGGAPNEIPPEQICICNLADPPPPAAPPADWKRPADKTYIKRQDGSEVVRKIAVSVDPVSGRIAFPAGVAPDAVFVLYSYGFPGDVGGGPYNRADWIDSAFHADSVWQVGVSRAFPAIGGETVFTHLADAVTAWNALPAGRVGVIVLMDSTSEHDDVAHPVPAIRIAEGSRLLLIAADWPIEPVPDSGGATERRAGQFSPDDVRAHFRGELTIEGSAPIDPSNPEESNPGELTLNGLVLEGRVRVRKAATAGDGSTVSGNLGKLSIVHCTLVPSVSTAGLTVNGDNSRLKVSIERSIVGAVDLPETTPEVSANESILDGHGADALVAPGSAAAFERCTVLGVASAKTVSASNSIFTSALIASRRQTGCVRFSSLAEGSKTPRRHRCQPDLALSLVDPALASATRKRLVPQFVSDIYGHHAYTQLAESCAVEIRTGAEDGADMGVWAILSQPQREANLRASLDEYLRFGLAAGVIHVT